MVVKAIALTLFMLCLWTSQTVHAETAYISDNLRVGVRLEPGTKSAPFTVLSTGDKLTILENKEGYSRIRSSKDKEGWVRNIYLTDTPPARLLIGELRENYNKVQKELADQQFLTQKIKLLNEENAVLQKKISVLDTEDSNLWIFFLIAEISVGCLAFMLGILSNKHRVAKKLGGLTL